MALKYYATKEFSLSKFIEGAFAGLACITAGSGYVSAGCASITGCCGALSAHLAIQFLNKHQFDDVLDVFALQVRHF